MTIWQWMQNELLGMQWLNRLIGSGLAALGVDGQVLSAGQVLSVEQAKALLAKVRG